MCSTNPTIPIKSCAVKVLVEDALSASQHLAKCREQAEKSFGVYSEALANSRQKAAISDEAIRQFEESILRRIELLRNASDGEWAKKVTETFGA
jgi:outer membrane lipopolysaccharide assembly protein LptE/RlpB